MEINKSLIAKIGAKAYIVSVLSNVLYDGKPSGFVNPEDLLVEYAEELRNLIEELEYLKRKENRKNNG